MSGRHARGLIALSGGRHGLVNSLVEKGKLQAAAKAAGTLVSAFGEGNFFIELDASYGSEETNRQLAELANNLGIPIVATNNVLYLKPEDATTAMALAAVRKGKGAFRGAVWDKLHEPEAHAAQGRAMVVDADDHLQPHPDLVDEVGTERYFKTAEQMVDLFEKYPQAIANTHFIAEQCNVELPMHKPLFPSADLSARSKIRSKGEREGEGEGEGDKPDQVQKEKETPDTESDGVNKIDAKPKEIRFRDETGRMAFELCSAMEGLPRHAGMHCGGVVISPGSAPIADLVPLQRSARDPNLAITQYEKDGIESLGLVKMDLLGSRALTTLVDAVQTSGLAKDQNRRRDAARTNISDIHELLEQIPFDDEATYRLMADANTIGCFQLESPGMRGLLKWLRPRNLTDITAAISLFRPGPMEGGFLETFMRRHMGYEPVTYPHPAMEPILKETHGVILFQEQFLQLAHVLAVIELGDAEHLRKQPGKARSPGERANLGRWFVAGAIERGIDQLQAEKVWEVVAGYTRFGFCKAHACSYALTAYRSAYMKTHYPAHFMAAQINNQGGYYPTAVYVEDARRQGLAIIPPHVNTSVAWCEVPARTRGIRFGLQFIKGLSERTIALLLSERRSGGPYRSLPDLMSRVDMTLAEIMALVKGGACDDLGGLGGEYDQYDEYNQYDAAPTAIPAIGPVQGPLGAPIGASREYRLNRKQLLWLLPSLLSARTARVGGFARTNLTQAALGQSQVMPTGSDGVRTGIQIAMGDMLSMLGTSGAAWPVGRVGGANSPKVLGNVDLYINVPQMGDYTPTEKLGLEQEAFGFALSHNEMEAYREVANRQGAVSSLKLSQYPDREVVVAGIAVAGHRHMTKEGEWMLFLTLQDCDGLIEIVLFPKIYKDSGEILANGGRGPYLVSGTVQVSGKGRGIGPQLPADLRPSDGVDIKMHPVLLAKAVRLLPTTT